MYVEGIYNIERRGILQSSALLTTLESQSHVKPLDLVPSADLRERYSLPYPEQITKLTTGICIDNGYSRKKYIRWGK